MLPQIFPSPRKIKLSELVSFDMKTYNMDSKPIIYPIMNGDRLMYKKNKITTMQVKNTECLNSNFKLNFDKNVKFINKKFDILIKEYRYIFD